MCTQFYWKNKKAKIKLTTSQKNKTQGGLEAPNFIYYFLANQLQYLVKWTKPPLNCTWLQLEQSYFKHLNLADISSLNTTLKKHPCFKNIAISTTLTAWWKTLKLTNSSTSPCKYTPIWHNPDFHINNTPLHYHTWEEQASSHGITHLQHLFTNNKFITFTQLTDQYKLDGSNNNFKYLQIRSIIQSKINITNNTLTPSQLLQDIKNFKELKKTYF